MPEIVNVLVVGAGVHGDRSHLDPILQLPDLAQVVAVADNRPERLEELGRLYGLNDDALEADWTKVIDDPNIHAVIGALPDRLHMELAEAAIGARKHLLGEKPLAINRQEYERLPGLLAEARAEGLVCMPCNPREAANPRRLLKTYVRDRGQLSADFGVGDLGALTGVTIESHYTAADPNKKGMHSSLAADKLNHDVMTLDQLVGIKAIERAFMSHNGDDMYSATLLASHNLPTSKSGKERMVELTSRARRTIDRDFRSDDKGIYHETVQLAFEQGSLALDTLLGTIVVWWGDIKVDEKQSDEYKTNYNRLFLAFNQHFLRAVRGEEKQCFTDKAKLLSTLAAIALEEADDRAITIRIPGA